MHRDTVDDIAEMAVFAREDGHRDWQIHGVATQDLRVENELKVSRGEGDCQRAVDVVCLTLDAMKYVMLGSYIFIPDFSERSELSWDSCSVYLG